MGDNTLKILIVAGARPNFMKIAPIIEVMEKYPAKIDYLLVHTGQHYDQKMSQSFFDALGLPTPDINLAVGSGSHAEQTARIMLAFEPVCLQHQPDLVVVVGDVNSTMACTITAKKLGIKVAHVEAGLRSRDMGMPEEINRLCTDVLCDYLFTNENLAAEGMPPEKIHFVGNVMIDTLLKHQARAKQLDTLKALNLQPGDYATMTLHRPSNVDNKTVFEEILKVFSEVTYRIPIVFPAHPRTLKMIHKYGLDSYFSQGSRVEGIWLTEPLGYLDFLNLNMHAKMVLTDSGGLQEETTALGVPCLTLRTNTERPITCEIGTNVLVGNNPDRIREAAFGILDGDDRRSFLPEKWDGKAAKRIVDVLIQSFHSTRQGGG